MGKVSAMDVIRKLDNVKESRDVLKALAGAYCNDEQFASLLGKVLSDRADVLRPTGKSVEVQVTQAIQQFNDYIEVLENMLRSMTCDWPPNFQ